MELKWLLSWSSRFCGKTELVTELRAKIFRILWTGSAFEISRIFRSPGVGIEGEVSLEPELQVLQDFSPHGRRAVLRQRLGTVEGQNLQCRPFEIGCETWVLLRRGTNR